MGKLKLWSHEEDCILAAVSSSTSSKKWKKASEQLKKQGYERTDIECRQRYVNHLDPTVNKQSWTDEELEVLYTKYSEYGNKWFLIQKHLPGRTQTKIKNYFYGNIRYLLKIILKFAFGKNRTGFVNDIKTQTLLEMYEGKGSNNRTYSEFAGETIIQKSIKRMDFRVSRNNCQKLMEDNMQVFSLFGKKYLMVKQKKEEVEVKAQEDFSYLQEKKVQNGLPQQELKFPKVDVVSSVEGEVNRKEQELAYLEKMAKLHYERYLHFQSLLNISELRTSE